MILPFIQRYNDEKEKLIKQIEEIELLKEEFFKLIR
jgi:hypothetical protein